MRRALNALLAQVGELERPPTAHETGHVVEYETEIADIADTVRRSEAYAAMLGMMKKQCLDNDLSEEAADEYVRMFVKKMGE